MWVIFAPLDPDPADQNQCRSMRTQLVFVVVVNLAFNWRVAGDSSADAHWWAALLVRRVQPAVQASQHSPQSQVLRGQETPGPCRLRTREVTQHSPPSTAGYRAYLFTVDGSTLFCTVTKNVGKCFQNSQTCNFSGALVPCSVADPGCLSRILIFTHSGSRIQKQQQKRGVEKKLLSNLFLQSQISQNWRLFYFLNAEEKKFEIWASFQTVIELFTQKFVTKL